MHATPAVSAVGYRQLHHHMRCALACLRVHCNVYACVWTLCIFRGLDTALGISCCVLRCISPNSRTCVASWMVAAAALSLRGATPAFGTTKPHRRFCHPQRYLLCALGFSRRFRHWTFSFARAAFIATPNYRTAFWTLPAFTTSAASSLRLYVSNRCVSFAHCWIPLYRYQLHRCVSQHTCSFRFRFGTVLCVPPAPTRLDSRWNTLHRAATLSSRGTGTFFRVRAYVFWDCVSLPVSNLLVPASSAGYLCRSASPLT